MGIFSLASRVPQGKWGEMGTGTFSDICLTRPVWLTTSRDFQGKENLPSILRFQDESVRMSAELTRERRQWIAKVLRQIGKIKPRIERTYSQSLQREAGFPGG